MGVLGWIIFGFIAGLLARAIMPGRDSMGLLATTVLGIIGAVVAGWIGQALGWYDRDSGAGLIAAIVGSIIVLGIYNAVVSRRKNVTSLDRSKKDRDRFAA